LQPASSTTSAPGLRPQRADARRNREAVLESARRVFAANGLDAQIDEIARGAGVGVGTVYRHFPTKEDLLEALAQARFEGLAERARQALESEDGWEGFVDFMTYSARVMAEDRLLSEAMDQRAEVCGDAAERAGLPDLVGRLLERAKATGKLRSDTERWEVPGLICGIGRAVRGAGSAPALSWERHLEIILAGLRVTPP
jgi:AcrR family transcriptional regulator